VKVVNTFISDGGPLPSYTEISLRQARKTNPDVEIDFICKDDQDIFSDLNINWVPQDDIKSSVLDEFNDVCWFKQHGTPNTTFKSPELFWHRTCERIYYLEAYINQGRFYDVFHFENDVLLYGDISTVPTDVNITLTPMAMKQVTFAFVHIPSPKCLNNLCKFFNMLLSHGNAALMQTYGFDHVSEMSLLHVANEQGAFCTFPLLPKFSDGSDWVFDPGSYGQYLGGTNNGHSEGFTDPSHIIGDAISKGHLDAEFSGSPKAIQGDTVKNIFNLHVHSKNLERFVDV
jgi:hypothetical protein|tara:strand:+ start:2035 stop:2895 length:861 start_codon:yes stop_codon:yes gene_type:complete